jgi:hypothetical protein
MSSLYAASELGTDLQSLGFLGHHGVDRERLRSLRKAMGIELPRTARWVARVASAHSIGRAELSGWILAGEHRPEPAGLPTYLDPTKTIGPDALPSAYFGGLLRIGQTPNGELWGADAHRKAMPVYILDPQPDGGRASWKRRFDRLDDFIFFAVKAALCQRDRITVEEFLDLARERGMRPEELVPDSLEDEREALARLGLRRAKKVPPIANRFIWLDVILARAYLKNAGLGDVARLWVDVHGLHQLREDNDKLTDPSAAAFWLFRHALFGDDAGYKRVLAKSPKKSPIVQAADQTSRRFWDKKKAPFDRAALARAIEMRIGMRGSRR